MSFIENFLDLFLDSAPWLLMGLFLAGMLKMFVPMEWMHKQLGGHGFKTTLKAAIFGAPLPLCSCGVIPAAVGLRRSGASKSATTSFLVSTPETGVDSVSVSYVLLGPFMAIVRPIAAVTSAVVAGLLVGKEEPAEAESKLKFKPLQPQKLTPLAATPLAMAAETSQQSCCASQSVVKPQPAPASSCCSSQPAAEVTSSCCATQPQPKPKAASSCCSSQAQAETSCCASKSTPASSDGLFSRLAQGINYAATDLIKDTTIWLLIGLFFAALVNTFVPPQYLSQWGDGILAMAVMVLVSIPMYICATASTPIAAGLLLAGVSPGAVLVFMMAGPATNIATLGVVSKELGKRALWGYLGGVIGTAVVFGYVVNLLVANYGFQVIPLVGEEHRMLPSWLTYACGGLLAVLMARTLANKLKTRWVAAA